MKYRCPVCKKVVEAPPQKHPEQAKLFPFCSRRCKLIDLGAWLDGKYKLISEPKTQDKIEPTGKANNNSTDR